MTLHIIKYLDLLNFLYSQDTNIRTVLVEERQMFVEIRQRLYALLEKQITEFRYYFPFGRPEGALKLTLGLLERVGYMDNFISPNYYCVCNLSFCSTRTQKFLACLLSLCCQSRKCVIFELLPRFCVSPD